MGQLSEIGTGHDNPSVALIAKHDNLRCSISTKCPSIVAFSSKLNVTTRISAGPLGFNLTFRK